MSPEERLLQKELIDAALNNAKQDYQPLIAYLDKEIGNEHGFRDGLGEEPWVGEGGMGLGLDGVRSVSFDEGLEIGEG